MSKPFFSVIVPSHNGAEYIGIALESIRKQTFDNYELIIVCDACTDDTEKIAESYGADIVSIDSHCEGFARNAGLERASGEWILFLDDDDWFLHEYCFQMIADRLASMHGDILNFGYIWKSRGYQTPHNTEYCMAWARAWKASFLKQYRFDDASFGTDKNLWNSAVANNPDVKIEYFEMPIVYYNYMRPGSMTDELKKRKQLDIIVTHYNEPWNVGKQLFDSINAQKLVDFESFTVTIVQDGEENALPWDELLKDYDIDIRTVSIPHSGMPAARNKGIQETYGDWIMFCDFDDMFPDVLSLNSLTRHLTNKSIDMICGVMQEERRENGGGKFVAQMEVPDMSSVLSKAYRRNVIERNDIEFNAVLPDHSDYIFNELFCYALEPYSIANINSDVNLYYKTLRENSSFNSAEGIKRKISTLFQRDCMMSMEMLRLKDVNIARKYAMSAFLDEYYRVSFEGVHKDPSDDFFTFFQSSWHKIEDMSRQEVDQLQELAHAEKEMLIKKLTNNYLVKCEYYNGSVSFEQWIRAMKEVIV